MATVGVKIRAIIPKEIFNDSKAKQNIEHTMRSKTVFELRRELQKTHSSWEHQPNWTIHQYSGPRVIWVKVLTYSTQYRLVNAGAKAHPIVPNHARLLRFQTGYKAKSRPRLIKSFAGGKYGAYRTALRVAHPGFEPREFDQKIAEDYAKTFLDDIQDAVTDAIVHR